LGGGALYDMKLKINPKFEEIISVENLYKAWQEFAVGKRKKKDVQIFAYTLMDSITQINSDLANKTYQHGGYYNFNISDPKPRLISKAGVRDRLVHHAIYRILYPFFDTLFIADSFSCRINKGTHRAINRFRAFFYKVSKNNTRSCWVLKCDVKKFFASIDHETLVTILKKYISDENIIWLLKDIISSFSISTKVGLPLGNLTSQLLVNVYMNEFDQYIKHTLKVKYYIRYSDDFVIFSRDRNSLFELIPQIKNFLEEHLKLYLHPNKVIVRTFGSGIDFLGWVHFQKHRVLRTSTKKRMNNRIKNHTKLETLHSYLGLLRHGDSYKLEQDLINSYWFLRVDKVMGMV